MATSTLLDITVRYLNVEDGFQNQFDVYRF